MSAKLYIHEHLNNILLEEYVPKALAEEFGKIIGRLIAGGVGISDITKEIDNLYKSHKIDNSMKHAIKTRIKFLATSMELI